MATFSLICAGTNQDSTLLRAGSGWVNALAIYNTAAAARYVKLYDKATAPASTDTPMMRLYLAVAPGKVELQLPPEEACFGAGLGVRITVGQADNDVAGATAGDVVLNIVYR